jgi:uncharacterized membrane-anchored protein
VTLTRRTLAFAAVAAAQVVFPLAMVGYNEVRLSHGKEILIKVQPVDPNDLLRGQYVALSYGISRLGLQYPPRTTIYVPLHRLGDGSWTGEAVRTERPGGTFIRGRRVGSHTEYGIETFYVEEGQGREYEDAASSRRLYARVSLESNGRALLKGLVIR